MKTNPERANYTLGTEKLHAPSVGNLLFFHLTTFDRPPLAQLTTLRDNLGAALALMFMVGFFWGVLKIWAGANAISKGDTEGKSGVIAGIIIAAAAAIMGVLYGIFGIQDAVLTPRF